MPDVSKVLLEHLSNQPTRHPRADYPDLPLRVAEAVRRALQQSLILVAELHAANEEVTFDWYSTGAKYDPERMCFGTHSARVEIKEGHTIAVTLLPRIGLRPAGGKLVTASPATVNLAE